MNIRVDLNYTIKDGVEVVFRSPVDCSQVTGLKVYYREEDGNTAFREFAFADAHGNNVGDIDHLFAENVVVKVILDVTAGMAFVQNADTNAYLEGRFEDLEKKIGTGGGGGASPELVAQVESNTNTINDLVNDYSALMNDVYINLTPRVDANTQSIGNIETALDAILAIQNELIGGDAV